MSDDPPDLLQFYASLETAELLKLRAIYVRMAEEPEPMNLDPRAIYERVLFINLALAERGHE